MTRPLLREDEIDRPLAEDLVGEVQAVDAGIVRLGVHRCRIATLGRWPNKLANSWTDDGAGWVRPVYLNGVGHFRSSRHQHAGTLRRLIGEGELPDQAERLVAQWELLAAQDGLERDGRYWDAGLDMDARPEALGGPGERCPESG
jgi:hypothetical protein